MIKVKVFAPFGYARKKLDEKGWMELKDGATLGDAVKELGLPSVISRIFMVRLNSEEVPFNTQLKDGDVIGYFSLIRGG